jgi:hypothetical protein
VQSYVIAHQFCDLDAAELKAHNGLGVRRTIDGVNDCLGPGKAAFQVVKASHICNLSLEQIGADHANRDV